MAALLRVAPSFRDDLVAHLRALRRDGRDERIRHLREDLRDARQLLGRFPNLGAIESGDESATLRRLILRRTPYLIWFVTEGRRRPTVTWLRLFHARQERRLR